MLINSWPWWANGLIWLLIVLTAVALLITIVKFFTKGVLIIITKVIIPILLVALVLGASFFIVVALADTYFGTSWWADSILPWFQGNSTSSSNLIFQNQFLILNY